jgi:hypothetical protein
MHASLRKGRLTDKAALEAAVELLDADQINLYGGNTDIAIAGRMDRLAAVDRAGFRALLATALASKNLTDDIQVERDENNGEKIVFRDFSIPRAVEGVPVIVLDATARPEVYAEAFGGRFQIHDCRIPETAKLTQIVCSGSRWTLFGKNPYAPDEKLSPESRAARRARVARLLQRCCERAAGRSMVLFAPQAFIDYVRERPDLMPEGAAIEMAHFNSFRGLNKFKELGFAAIVGRNLPAVAAMERDRAAMARKTGSTPITVDGYERQHRPNVAKPDHGYLGTPLQPRHPDPVTEGLRYNVAEGEAIQAGGRLRSLRRDDELEILSVHGLDLSEGFGREPDETIQWSRFMQFGKTALAQYIERCFDELESVPLGPVDMVTLAPDLFENEQAAKDALRNAGDFGGYASGRYWREGQRKPSRFLRPHGFTGARCEQLLRQALWCCVRVEI